MQLFVESEFAPLRRVVLAQSEFSFPTTPLTEMEKSFLLPEVVEMFEQGYGQNFKDAFPALQAQWEKEREQFSALLERYDVEVFRPRLLTIEEKELHQSNGYSNFFVRDPFFVIGDHVIEGSLRFKHRRSEIFPLRPIMREQVMTVPCAYYAIPQPEETTADFGPYLEGGDIHVVGKQVFIGYSGLASNIQGAQWLTKMLERDGYTIELVSLHENILHLDCAMSLVREGLMIVCEEAFKDGLPSYFANWTKIPVSIAQCATLITNGLPLSPHVYVTDPQFKALGEQLESHGVTVEYIDFAISRSFGGSFRCSTQPLLRKF